MPTFKGLLRIAAIGAAVMGAPLHAWADPTYTVIHHFTGGAGGGKLDVLIGREAVAGVPSSFSLFGETHYGGGAKGGWACPEVDGCGTVFQLTPPASGAPAWAWTETVLYRFHGYDGSFPQGGLVLDSSGALYGATYGSDPDDGGGGEVFRLTPPPPGQGYFWHLMNLYKIGSTEVGQHPNYPVTGSDGSFYTVDAFSEGQDIPEAIYRFTPPASGKGGYSKSLLYAFTGNYTSVGDGGAPNGSLVLGPTGTLYGTTEYGGVSQRGSVFSLSPPGPGETKWTFATIYSFSPFRQPSGLYPSAGLIQDKDGALYGTTAGGGSANGGTVFKLTPPAPGQTTWTKTTLCSFGPSTPRYPVSTLVADGSGALYGVANAGTQDGQTYGAVFKVTPPATGKTAWTISNLHNFGGPPYDGSLVGGGIGVTLDPSGNVYGTTIFGGIYNWGIAFKITP